MLYQNVGTINKNPISGTTYSDSWVLYLTPGSNIASVKCRRVGVGWLSALEDTIVLPYAFDGASAIKIWIISDTHIGWTDSKAELEAAIADIDGAEMLDYVFVLGDVAANPTEAEYDDFISARGTSNVPSGNWYELAGNHDVQVRSPLDASYFKAKLSYTDLYYTVTIDNAFFVFVGDEGGTYGQIQTATLTWLKSQLSANSDKNIFMFCHYGVYDTNYLMTDADYYSTPTADVRNLIVYENINAWFHGHAHKDADSTLAKQEPIIHETLSLADSITGLTLELSDSISFSEEIKLSITQIGLSDSISFSDSLLGVIDFHLELQDSLAVLAECKVIHCYPGAVKQSKYGMFKYAQAKYGLNVRICRGVSIEEEILTLFNGEYSKVLSDSQTITELFQESVNYNLDFSESIGINDGSGRSIFLNFSETVSILESKVTLINVIFSENLSISEQFQKTTSFILEFSESVVINDGSGINIYVPLSDSVSISESMTAYFVFILSFSESVPIDAFAEVDLIEPLSEKSDWRFIIKTPAGARVASLINARNRWIVERLNQESEAGFILDADDVKCTSTILNLGVNELHIYYKGDLWWTGQLVSAKKTANGNDIYWEVLAKDWVSLLSKRFCGVESVRTFTTTDAGTVAWTLISEAQALANGSFGITLGSITPSVARTVTYDKKNILEAIKELSNLGQDGSASYGMDFEVTPSKVFNVYYPYKGSILNDVVFRYPGNCETFDALVDTWGIINQEWGLGRHWTGQTAIVSRADATSQTTYKRREAIKNYRDMSVLAFLQDMVYQDIQWSKDPSTVIRFVSRVDEKSDIRDYSVGDAVVVICDKFNIDESLWVYDRKIEIGENDELKISLTVGD